MEVEDGPDAGEVLAEAGAQTGGSGDVPGCVTGGIDAMVAGESGLAEIRGGIDAVLEVEVVAAVGQDFGAAEDEGGIGGPDRGAEFTEDAVARGRKNKVPRCQDEHHPAEECDDEQPEEGAFVILLHGALPGGALRRVEFVEPVMKQGPTQRFFGFGVGRFIEACLLYFFIWACHALVSSASFEGLRLAKLTDSARSVERS